MNTVSTLDALGDVAEEAYELTVLLDGEPAVVSVRRSGLLSCLEKDVSQADRLTGALVNVLVLRRQQRTLSNGADRAYDRAAMRLVKEIRRTIAVLHRLRTAVERSPHDLGVLAAAAAAHLVLHGSLGSTTTNGNSFARPPLNLPTALPVHFATLVVQREAVTNVLAGLRGGHAGQAAFGEDVQRLRRWALHSPQLRAPDELVEDLAAPGGLRPAAVVARPATPRLTERVAVACDYETIGATQLTLTHLLLRSGHGPEAAARQASTADRELRPADVVQSASRFGIWAQQSQLSGDLPPRPAAALGLSPGDRVSPAQLRQLLRTMVEGGAEHGLVTGPYRTEPMRIDSGWFDPAWGGVPDAVRLFAVLYSPAVGEWYRIVRGDVHDLLGLTPMRQVHYSALIGHVAVGGTLSEYAGLQGRRYREVLAAWDELLAHAAHIHAAANCIGGATALLPDRAEPGNLTQVVDAVHALVRQLRDIGADTTELEEALSAFTSKANTDSARTDSSYQVLRARLARLRHHVLGRQLPLDPAQWTPLDIAEFYNQRPGLTTTVHEGQSPRARGIAAIRAEITRLVDEAPSGAPRTALELLTELHHALGQALRAQESPRLPPRWRLDLEPGGAHHHIWRTFQDWPDIVTVVATAKELAGEAKPA